VVRDKYQAWLERPQWVTGEWTSQCEHSIQRVPLGGGKQLASASRQHGTHRGIIVWQWLRVAVVRDKCQACPERPQRVTGEWTSQCEHSIQRVPLGGGKQLAMCMLAARHPSWHHRMAVAEGSRGA